jgi:hypothetical protein
LKGRGQDEPQLSCGSSYNSLSLQMQGHGIECPCHNKFR